MAPPDESQHHTFNIQVQVIEPGTELFEAVIALHTGKKATLGPFPRGAFEDHAAKGWILGAVADNGRLAGYLLYRRSRSKATIAHLTRHDDFAGSGVPKLLVDETKSRTKDSPGISLHCRRDYGLNDMWSGFGFTVRGTRPGRGSDGALVDYWWFDHGHEDLFSLAAESEDCAQLAAAVDANVLYDLVDSNRPHHDDTSVLLAEWLRDSLELCVTPEIYHEISRNDNLAEQQRTREFTSGLRTLKTVTSEFDGAYNFLCEKFGEPITVRDKSDFRQLAHSIAADVPFFVTRDDTMLQRHDTVLEQFPIRIVHPTDLVNHFDTLRRSAAYRPVLLKGSSWQRKLVVAPDIDAIVAAFKHDNRERNSELERALRGWLAHPESYQLFAIHDGGGTREIVASVSISDPLRCEILLLRHLDSPASPTLVRHIVHEILGALPKAGWRHFIVTEPYLSDASRHALESLGFFHTGEAWHKLSVSGIRTTEELKAVVAASTLPDALRGIFELWLNGEPDHDQMEHAFAPVKITAYLQASFVVSIRKGWAEQLFAEAFDGQTLLATSDRLLIGIEGVYYCSANNRHLTAPSRVLWYVSGSGNSGGPMTVIGCSHIEEIAVERPKVIFPKYRHLGVYSFYEVRDAAGGSNGNDVTAFRFTRTERFLTPVTLEQLKAIGVAQPQNPRKISNDQFAAIYRIGMNLFP